MVHTIVYKHHLINKLVVWDWAFPSNHPFHPNRNPNHQVTMILNVLDVAPPPPISLNQKHPWRLKHGTQRQEGLEDVKLPFPGGDFLGWVSPWKFPCGLKFPTRCASTTWLPHQRCRMFGGCCWTGHVPVSITSNIWKMLVYVSVCVSVFLWNRRKVGVTSTDGWGRWGLVVFSLKRRGFPESRKTPTCSIKSNNHRLQKRSRSWMNRFNKNHGAKMEVESGEVKSYPLIFHG